MTIQFELKDVYGKVKAYPKNDVAENLASIAGTKTLTRATLRAAHEMGFDFVVLVRLGEHATKPYALDADGRADVLAQVAA